MASYARHVANRYGRTNDAGVAVPVRSVGIYVVYHAARSPAQVRAGWEASDLRTHQTWFAGAYQADGQRVDEFRPYVKEQSIPFVVAGILEVDLYPLRAKHQGSDSAQLMDDLGLPAPIRRLLDRFPELTEPERKPDNLRARIEELIGPP